VCRDDDHRQRFLGRGAGDGGSDNRQRLGVQRETGKSRPFGGGDDDRGNETDEATGVHDGSPVAKTGGDDSSAMVSV